ncbi:MAG: M1 family metallopeptidase [Thermoplasmata archaeon]
MRAPRMDWSLDVQYRTKTFSGKVTIHLEDADPTLVVDSADLDIEATHLDGRPVSFVEDRDAGVLRFEQFPPGAHQLQVAYRGAVSDTSLLGLYSSPAGSGYVLTTMMYPTGSRRLVPCFEAPSIKSVYALSLTVDDGVHAIFNTDATHETVEGERRRIEFSPTPPMSAYLLYLGIGRFDVVERGPAKRRVIVAVSPGRAGAGEFAATHATELVEGFESYYGQPYPLRKLHLVGVENFWAGAQENWGAIVFREYILLVGPTTSERMRRVVRLVLSHEIAHQWFGNLVTPEWWDDFWLNESFATFAASKMIDRLYPDQETWSDFLGDEAPSAFELDSLRATHPMQVPMKNASEVSEIGDEVTYGKGGCVLRMIEAYLGEETFRNGVIQYLEKFRFANARTSDLWACLEAAAQEPVLRIMQEWVTRPGHPVVEVASDGQGLHFRQHRFLADGSVENGIWPIPLRVQVNGAVHRILFDTPTLDVPLPPAPDLCVDPGRFGFYRVAYDARLLDQVWSAFLQWSPVDQWGLVQDVTSLVVSGDLPFERYLEALAKGRDITAYLPLRGLLDSVVQFRPVLIDFVPFKDGMHRFLVHQLERIGLANVPHAPATDSILRERLAVNLARLDGNFARQLGNRFSEWETAPADLRVAIAIGFARTGGKTAFATLLERLRTTLRDEERLQMLAGIASCPDPELLKGALTMFPGQGVSPSLYWNLLEGVCNNDDVREFHWPWIAEQLPRLAKIWEHSPILSTFLRSNISIFGLDHEPEVREYFATHSDPETVRGIRVGLEALSVYSRFRERLRQRGH